MFDWGNWIIETVIAVFFISGFVIFYNSRLVVLWDIVRNQRLGEHLASTIFIFGMVGFCLLAAYWNPNNATAYLNWALYILFVPLVDANITPPEFLVRSAGILAFWFYTNSVRGQFFVLSLVSVIVILTIMYRFGTMIHTHLLLNMEVAAWISVAFWITQTQLTTVASVMGSVMFVLMNLFTNLYWSSERLAALERNRLEQQVNSDALTHAGSFFAFKAASTKALAQAQHDHTALTLVMFDIDHFKQVNDTYGHAAGNTVLQGVAEIVQQAVSVRLYRTGGEEFNLIFTKADPNIAKTMQTLHQAVGNATFNYAGTAIHVTLSMGITTLKHADVSFEDVYERADANLYLSKRSGRNCITVDGQQLT
ncbi:GGDEF domain-containing protein [Lacticaseibacillus jixiensis]|uniref:GGDEF domain-containing protein n=1 Tax=Lacticaseibacillus jixiensis TaxID=3231926 RepID=UPI0036F34EA9